MIVVRVCGAGLTYAPTHWPLPSDIAAKKRAQNGACFPIAMATLGWEAAFPTSHGSEPL